MPVVAGNIQYSSVCGVFLILSFLLCWILIKRTRIPKLLIVISVPITSCLLTFFIWFPIASKISHKAQAQVAQTYIQNALDEQCKEQGYTADTEGFYFEVLPYGINIPEGQPRFSAGTIMHWGSQDRLVDCKYSEVTTVWTCACP
jgi:hypothetical protein